MNHPLDGAFELANIARPGALIQQAFRAGFQPNTSLRGGRGLTEESRPQAPRLEACSLLWIGERPTRSRARFWLLSGSSPEAYCNEATLGDQMNESEEGENHE